MISSTPRAAVMPSVPTDTEMMAASVGPKHGVQPSANIPPSSGAPSQVVQRFGAMRVSFCSAGIAPRKTTPIRMVTPPPMRMSVSSLSRSAEIAPNTETVASRKTTVKPRMNKAAASATAHCLRLPTPTPNSPSNVTSPPTTPAR